MPRRVWAKLIPKGHVVKAHSFEGRAPSTRQEELEVTHTALGEIDPRIVGTKLCYNHDDGTNLGVVGDRRINADGSMDVGMDIDETTPLGEAVMKSVENGSLMGVSLSHKFYSNEPIEVSLCTEGARKGSGIYFDGKTGRYVSNLGYEDPHIEASATLEQKNKTAMGFIFYPCMVIKASADEAVAPPAEAAPASAPVPTQQPQPDVEMKDATTAEEESKTEIDEAKAQEEKKALEAKYLKATTKVNEMLRDSHNIPSKENKKEIANTVRELEMAKVDQEREIARLQAELEEARKLAEHKAKVGEGLARINADLGRTLKSHVPDINPNVLASMNPAQKAAMDSMTPAQKEAMAAALATQKKEFKKKSSVEEATDKKYTEWLRAQETKATGGYTTPPTAGLSQPSSSPEMSQPPPTPQQQPIVSASVDEWSQPGIPLKSINYFAARMKDHKKRAEVVRASKQLPIDYVVQASRRPDFTQLDARREEDEKGEFVPGQGPNFDKYMLRTPQQMALHHSFNQRHQVSDLFKPSEMLGRSADIMYRDVCRERERAAAMNMRSGTYVEDGFP